MTINSTAMSLPSGEPPDLKAQAKSLAAARRFADAIAVATQLNRVQPDTELERLLVAWRLAALKSLKRADANPDWPGDLEDPFPGLSGLPEISGGELTAKILAGAIVHHGALLVRGLVAADEASRFRAGIDEAFAGFDAWLASSNLPQLRFGLPDLIAAWLAKRNPPVTPWFAPAKLPTAVAKTRPWVREGAGTLAVDSPHMLFEIVELLERTGLREMVAEYFAERPALSAGKTVLRKVPASLSQTGWHQDGAFLGKGIRSVNLWLALSDCGRDASGLDVVPKRIPHIVETGTQGAPLNWIVGPGVLDQIAKDTPVCSPDFAAGDALLFDHFFLHRTSLPANRTKDRWALECWMFAPSCYPLDQRALLI